MRGDSDGVEAGGAGGDAGDEGDEVEGRVGAPGVGVGAGGFGSFGPGGEAELEHLAPRVELRDVVVAEAGVDHGAGDVKAEVVAGCGDGWG